MKRTLAQQVQSTERATNEVADVMHSHKFWLAELVASVLSLVLFWR
ncbi:MAG: hypothetical protein IT464_11415 [Planctomycetes bacterium]|nr:hypothetical protein [Planctomycetota bacterium]